MNYSRHGGYRDPRPYGHLSYVFCCLSQPITDYAANEVLVLVGWKGRRVRAKILVAGNFGATPMFFGNRSTTSGHTTFGYDLNLDVRAVEVMANGLVPYVYQDDLYGLTSGNLPKLTLGGLLMRLHRLRQIYGLLTPEQQAVVVQAQAKLDETRTEWHVHVVGKLKREFKARIEAVEQFLNECSDNLRGCAENYLPQTEKRVIIEMLYRELDALNELSDDLIRRLTALDNGLRRFADEKTQFRWDGRLASVYPPEQFWFLYRAVSVTQERKQ
jgi:hypothetical protein